jgi:hypothetical protein
MNRKITVLSALKFAIALYRIYPNGVGAVCWGVEESLNIKVDLYF